MLLATKFLRPSSAPHCVQRERLYRLLDPATPKRLNLVIAPAGFGKTTLAAQWCARHPAPSAWLSLDENDDEPVRFWQYLVGALAHAGLPGLAHQDKAQDDGSEGAINAGITKLVNVLAEDGRPWSLVLDDFQVIGNRLILRQLAYFIDHLPKGITLTLASRTEPALPLPRWRVRCWVQDIHPSLLAFTVGECRQFFHDTMAMNLSEETLDRICRRTEGWVAAMQLSALARNQDTDSSSIQPPAFAADPRHTGERQISDYILSEVLDQQAPEQVRFMLETACCPRLCASLCDAIRGTGDSQEQLRKLYRLNLFLIPLDEQGNWYRYHDLFRDALLQRIRQTDPDRAMQLLRNTIVWLLEHDQVQEAIAQILRLQDWPWLATVLEEHGNRLILGGHHLPVLDWLEKLPGSLTGKRPQLQMLQIWALFFANRLDGLEPLLSSLEEFLDAGNPDHELSGLRSEMALVRSYLARSRNDDRSVRDLTRQVLADLEHTRIPLKSVTYYGLGLDGYGRGDLASAEEALISSIHYGKAEQQPSTVLSSGGLLAWIQYHRGQLDQALKTARSVQHWVDRHHGDPEQPRLISCWLNSALTEICRERNEPDQAGAHLAPLLEHVNQGTEPGQHVVIQYVRGHLAFSLGRYTEALEVLEDAADLCHSHRSHMVFEPPPCAALLGLCHLASGHTDRALACIDSLDVDSLCNPLNREQYLICRARILLALDRDREAKDILVTLRSATQSRGHTRNQVETMVLLAEVLHKEGNKEYSQKLLVAAMTTASECGFLRVFAEQHPELKTRIRSLPVPAPPGRWHRKLAELLENEIRRPEQESADAQEQPEPGLHESLSLREQEVLTLISEGYANKEIAEQLSVAPATVKAHIRNLYGKLGVGRRTEALARARTLGLLS